jgi:hypothetical protein
MQKYSQYEQVRLDVSRNQWDRLSKCVGLLVNPFAISESRAWVSRNAHLPIDSATGNGIRSIAVRRISCQWRFFLIRRIRPSEVGLSFCVVKAFCCRVAVCTQ